MLCNCIDLGFPTYGDLMGHNSRPSIMPEDMDLLIRIAKHGYIDMEYVHMFAYPGRKKRTKEDRILQLAKHHYILINRTFIPPDYTTSYKTGYRIISLGKQGIDLLDAYDHEVSGNIKSIQTSSPYRMYHQVQVTTVCDVLAEKYQESDTTKWMVDRVLNEKEAYSEKALNQPDALLVCKMKNAEKKTAAVLVFIEIERSYASQKSLERKMKGYRLSIQERIYPQLLQENAIDQRVLFVAQTQNQKMALLSKIKDSDIARDIRVLVTGYQEITNDPLGVIYTNPVDDLTYKLLGKID